MPEHDHMLSAAPAAAAGEERPRSRRRPAARGLGLTLLAAVTVTATGCSALGGGGKTYDIGPIFPLSSDKCERYEGRAEGDGPFAKCWVDQEQCRRAAADWQESMRSGGVNDALNFSCD